MPPSTPEQPDDQPDNQPEDQSANQPDIEPDTKDWTWVLERPCPDCGFDARAVVRLEIRNRISANASAWQGVLRSPSVAERPRPTVWSALEYACHVRDVHRVFTERVGLMVLEDDPVFDNWDQDAAAVAGDYAHQDAAAVAGQLAEAADAAREAYGAVRDEQWERPGRRSNGSVFTVESLARYHLHDVEHHLHDVGGPGQGPGAGREGVS